MDVIEAAASGNITILLAVIVVSLSAIIAFLFREVLKELRNRVEREEELTDTAIASFDKLATSMEAALTELRARRTR
jgi:hypothetical protein